MVYCGAWQLGRKLDAPREFRYREAGGCVRSRLIVYPQQIAMVKFQRKLTPPNTAKQ